ncbi:MAG TPA: transketolase C-terminal domain-containing protein [Anaerolineae bacterium]|nr:transketolase C-terminal domain-containing protein [Anaerolineae bacterium]HOQ99507.1 transketolase C-terminal domain-containing protein [Anaerolineae bacterium]
MMVEIRLIPQSEFQRIAAAPLAQHEKLALIADMCRANTLAAVKRAGSGHLGSSLSAMDIVVHLYYHEINTVATGLDNPNRDIYFSSKGHDVPGLYSVLFSLGLLPEAKLLALRRLNGLDGHPDIGTPGIEANSGSLGMGISKGRGMAWAKRYLGHSGRVFVMTGDGEFQEGQNYEALQAAAQQQVDKLTVIVDHNKVQSDKLVSAIVDLRALEDKLRCFGWFVARCDGHDQGDLARVFAQFRQVTDRPKVLIADTIKGRGISFMEHPAALSEGKGLYRWHSGAPSDQDFVAAYEEVIARLQERFQQLALPPLVSQIVAPEAKPAHKPAISLAGEPASPGNQAPTASSVTVEYVADAYGQALLDLAASRTDLIVLDADLASDCRVRGFEDTYPERFIENGIAEQDMVSMAAGLARQGLLPVVNSFASFLASRANEQIYNAASEQTKIIYACHYAGLIPAGPGKSHQSIRDISLFGALPNCIILQPCNAAETRMALEYCVNVATESCALRLAIGPSPRRIVLPESYALTLGRGVALTSGEDAILFAYGPVMMHEALLAAELLAQRGFGLRVINMPWLNRVDASWLAEAIGQVRHLFVLEDHAPVGGLGDHLLNTLVAGNMLEGRHFAKFAVEGYPACGTPPQALAHHRLDGASLAEAIGRLWEGRHPCDA